MSGIEWSKAPQGATHWVNSQIACWHKHVNGTCLYWSQYQQEWVDLHQSEEATIKDYGEDGVIKRPEASEWTGTGLPPVGADVECTFAVEGQAIWHRGSVVYRGIQPEGGEFVVVETAKASACYRSGNPVMIRPYRTEAQIAAEERVKEIDALCSDIVSHYEAPKMSEHYLGLAKALHKAGYRKTEAP